MVILFPDTGYDFLKQTDFMNLLLLQSMEKWKM